MPAGQCDPLAALSKGSQQRNSGKALGIALPARGNLPGGEDVTGIARRRQRGGLSLGFAL